MARQSTTPVEFSRSIRKDTAVTMTSGRAGKVIPVAYIPLLSGDAATGRVAIDVQLAEMPMPLLNGVSANFQAWFVPKSSHPQFPGRDELMHARTGELIKSLGAPDRTPPAFFFNTTVGNTPTVANSEMFKALGIHIPTGGTVNTDLIDAFNVIYNFRLAAHSSRLTRRQYASESLANSTSLPPAFWPSSRFSHVVPDYERALIVGALDLDVIAGRIPVHGIGFEAANPQVANADVKTTGWLPTSVTRKAAFSDSAVGRRLAVAVGGVDPATYFPDVFIDLAGRTVGVTLADIDKARTTQAFARLRTAYSGNDSTGFDNDDTIVAHLMMGIQVQPDDFKRPWLLDSKRVGVGFAERHATDGASLDQSVTQGRASVTLSLNVPHQDVSGVIIVTCEVLPERIDERMSDEWLLASKYDDLPNALRDIQRTEPVDLFLNRRVDAKHTTPNGVYGHEPMNKKWDRDFTRLGGVFYQATPGAGWTENRSSIWQTEIVNPAYGTTHYLAPAPFPHDVFADQNADAFEAVVRHVVTINGITQIGDVLAENNDDYEAVESAGV